MPSNSDSDKLNRAKRDFVLDCCNAVKNRIREYNGLNDECLKYFFERPVYKRQIERINLTQSGSKPKLNIKSTSIVNCEEIKKY